MTPSTLVRRPRGPFTFVGLSSFFLEREREPLPLPPVTRRTRRHVCVAKIDDGRSCGLPAHYVDMLRGGFVCDDHRPVKRELVQV